MLLNEVSQHSYQKLEDQRIQNEIEKNYFKCGIWTVQIWLEKTTALRDAQ